MKRNSVKVCIRTRPTQYFAQDNIAIDVEHGTIQINNDRGDEVIVAGGPNNKQNLFKFRFDHVFHNASQTSVYDLFARDTVQGVVDGINGAIMSYGQTGSGKSFTMTGDTQNYEHRGVAPRSISQIFSEVNSRLEFDFRVSCTYCEIYNEKIFDLMADLSNPDQAVDFTVAEEKDGRGTFVRGLSEVVVKSETEALNLLFSGELARTTATHKLNRKSNRSHSIFTIYLQQRLRSGVSERVVHSKLHLVDLAGSERLKKTLDSADGSIGDEVTRRESMQINQSLTYLEQCVVALSKKGNTHVPYRQSKLTNVLKDCLGANCNTLMLACIWGEATHLEETVSTLRLASRMRHVQNETVMVETVDSSALIKKQGKLIKALKQELLMHDALVERTGIAYEPYTPEQQTNISHMLERYVASSEAEEEDFLSINSYRQMIEICKQFKKIVLDARFEAAAARDDAIAGMTAFPEDAAYDGGFTQTAALDSRLEKEFDPKAPYVGESRRNSGGFSLGNSYQDSRPLGGVEGIAKFSVRSPGAPSVTTFTDKSGYRSKDQSNRSSTSSSIDMSAILGQLNSPGSMGRTMDSFVRTEGCTLYESFKSIKTEYKDLKCRNKDCSAAVNDAKATIDKLQSQLEVRKASRIEMLRRTGLKATETEDIVDEEEFKLMKELRDAKRSYKNRFEQLQKYRSALSQSLTSLELVKLELASAYSEWEGGRGRNRGLESSFDQTRESTIFSTSYPGHRVVDSYGSDRDADSLDDQEAFDRMEEERVLANDPDSLAFYRAQKTKAAHKTQNFNSIRQMQRNKRM